MAAHNYTVNQEIFARILFSRIAVKDIFATLDHDLCVSVNYRVISLFHEDFIFMKLHILEVSQK